MAALKLIKQQEIPFVLDGRTITKRVTKNTTCSDVIEKLPKLEVPLAVFEKVDDGAEKELTGKTKLLKVWRANGSAKKVEFVIQRSQKLSNGKKFTRKLSASKNFVRPAVKNSKGKELSKDTLKKVSDLAFYARYQKTKVEALRKKADDTSVSSEQSRLMERMTSNASLNSMDAFLAKADLNEMAKLLSFCNEVTAEKLGKGTPRSQNQRSVTSRKKTEKHAIHDSLTSMKLGLKQKFAPKKAVERTTSTGTINSTDTGYHSVGSEGPNSSDDKSSWTSVTNDRDPKRHTSLFTNLAGDFRHSTPVSGRSRKRSADVFDSTFAAGNTLTTDKIEQLNENMGKTMIFKKFMADQASFNTGNDVSGSLDMKKRRTESDSITTFDSQKDVCRFLWDQHCDSDSESDISEPCEYLDIAFNADETYDNDTVRSQPRTLRRESAISDLNRFSLLSRDIRLDTIDESNDFDYSFDCSFPRMDETQSKDFTMDFSCDFDESDSENEAENNEDDSMDSFMKTRSFFDISVDLNM